MGQKYKPKRDIPTAARELKSLSPSAIREWIKNHRTKRDNQTKKRVQKLVTSQSISMWFKRHPKEYAKLKAKIEEEELTRVAISETLFENGAFRKIPCVEQWIIELRGRPANEESINQFVRYLKQICKGIIPRTREERTQKLPNKIIEEWGLKHPRALTVQDGLRYNSELMQIRGKPSRNHKLALRSFFSSRGLQGWKKISGKLDTQKGKYAHFYASPDKMKEIFHIVRSMNEEVYMASKFGFKCGGARTTATLNAEARNVDKEKQTIILWEKASLNQPKRKVEKVIPPDFYEELRPRIERGGKLFRIKPQEVNNILRMAYKKVIPELEKQIIMPFHFITRHQFAQHMLRATDWNYGLVARLGDWKVQTLEDYYGAMDLKTAMTTGRKYMAQI